MREYRCSGCGAVNRAANDLTGIRHTMTGGKPSNCQGTYQPADGDEPDRAAEYERARRDRLTGQDRQELEQQRAAIKVEEAKLRELYDALEGATGGGEAIEQP